MRLLPKNRNQHGFPLTKGEFEATGTHFVSFWWGIFWKEALGVLAAYIAVSLILAIDWGFEGYALWALYLTLAVLCLAGWAYLMTEIFYATLEKRFPRKSFKTLPADKGGNPIMPTLEQARALTWSFGWAHLSIPLFVLVVGVVIELLMWLFTGAPLTGFSFTLLFHSFLDPWLVTMWLVIFSFYPHFYVYSRPYHSLAGFRLAFVGY